MPAFQNELPKERRVHILDRLAWSELFEEFMDTKFSAVKRFGLEGCSVVIPGMKAIIDKAAEQGVRSVVIGTAHRGSHPHDHAHPFMD